VEYRAHGLALKGQLDDALSGSDADRASISLSIDELRALGSVITLEGDDATYPLKIESLEKFTPGGTKKPRVPKWLLLSVQPATSELPERAVVWVADAYRCPVPLPAHHADLQRQRTQAQTGRCGAPLPKSGSQHR
jgi:hypothetical protein